MERNSNKSSEILKIISDNKYFIVPFLIFFILIMTTLGLQGNDRVFLELNANHSKIADFLFLFLTNLGNGGIAFLLILALLRVSYREALSFLVITLLLTLLVNLLKNIIFPGFDRPVMYFGPSALHLIPGYKPPLLHTFPSGHTVTAFSISLYLAFLTQKKTIKLILFLLAVSIGYSRIYLSAHFPFDVSIGAVLAVVVTTLVYTLSRHIKNNWIDKKLRINFRPEVKMYDSKSFRRKPLSDSDFPPRSSGLFTV